MIVDAKPIQIEGERNVFCPYYKGCLEYAAKNYWDFWNCKQCGHQDQYQPIAEIQLLSSARNDGAYQVIPTKIASFYGGLNNDEG